MVQSVCNWPLIKYGNGPRFGLEAKIEECSSFRDKIDMAINGHVVDIAI